MSSQIRPRLVLYSVSFSSASCRKNLRRSSSLRLATGLGSVVKNGSTIPLRKFEALFEALIVCTSLRRICVYARSKNRKGQRQRNSRHVLAHNLAGTRRRWLPPQFHVETSATWSRADAARVNDGGRVGGRGGGGR